MVFDQIFTTNGL